MIKVLYHGDDLREHKKNKIVKLSTGNCYDIDELFEYIIKTGKITDPIDNTKMTMDDINLLINNKYFNVSRGKSAITLLKKQLIPPYIKLVNDNPELMDYILILGKICVSDYSGEKIEDTTGKVLQKEGDFNSYVDIGIFNEYINSKFTEEQKEILLNDLTTAHGLNR